MIQQGRGETTGYLRLSSLLPAMAAAVFLLFHPFLYQIKILTKIQQPDLFAIWLAGILCWWGNILSYGLRSDRLGVICTILISIICLEGLIRLPDDNCLHALINLFSYAGIFLYFRRYFSCHGITPLIIIIGPSFVLQIYFGWQSALQPPLDALSIKGWFGNSGYFANYIGIAVPFFVSALANRKHLRLGHLMLHVLAGTSTILILVLTNARAAFIGVVIGSMLALWPRIKQLSSGRFTGLKALRGLVVIVSIFIAALYLLFVQKIDSVKGRWTIYQVTLKIIKDHPLIGVGPNRFGAEYNEYQSAHFARDHSSVKTQLLATDTFEAFNIVLQVTAEYGIIVCLMILYAIVLLFRKKIVVKNDLSPAGWVYLGAKGGISVILVAALFSNPFHISTACVVFTLLVSALVSVKLTYNNKPGLFRLQRLVGIGVLAAVSLALVLYIFCLNKAERAWKKASDLASVEEFRAAEPLYASCFSMLRNNGRYLYDYGVACILAGNFRAGRLLLERSLRYYSNSNTHIYLGDAYRSLGASESAELQYRIAISMVPSHFFARYQLIRLYVDQKETLKAQRCIKESLAMPVKIDNEETLNILDSIRAIQVR